MNRRRLVIAAAAALTAAGWWFCGWQLLRTREWRDEEFEFAEFGLVTKLGRILSAAGSPLAYTVQVWHFHPAEKPEYVIVVSFTKPKSAHTGEEVAVSAWNGIVDRMSLQKTK